MASSKIIDQRVASAFFGNFRNLKENQEAAIAHLLADKNIVLTSGTGSGKTEAVVAPLVSKYWKEGITQNTLFLLYIAPTKALVNDLYKRLNPPLNLLGLRVGIRHGDRDDLSRALIPHVLITTPESLDVLLFRKDKALKNIRAVVIDEVHLLYNTQRGLHLSILLRRLGIFINRSFQWAALSATVENLSFIRDFLMSNNEKAEFLNFPPTRLIDSRIFSIKSKVEFTDLVRKLVLGRSIKLLIFTNSRRECEILSGALQEYDDLKQNVFTHYSSLSTDVRLEVEKKFALKKTAICIATSTLELGIDIGDIDAVLLWGMPAGIDSFLQRIGRSNRRSNKTNVVCMITDNSSNVNIDALHFIALIEAASNGELSSQKPFELFGAVGQQSINIIASNNGGFTRVADLHKMFEHKTHLTRAVIEEVLSELSYNGFLKKHGFKNQYGADDLLYKLLDMRLIYGNFSWGSQSVELYYKEKLLGEVPAVNLLRINHDDSVRFAGKNWRVRKISNTGVYLEPLKARVNAKDFTYGGRKITSDPGTINRIWQMIHSDHLRIELLSKELASTVCSYSSKIKRQISINNIPYFINSEGLTYFTFAGNIVNRAICLFSNQLDFETDDYSIKASGPIDWRSIPPNPVGYGNCFDLLFEETAEQSLYQKQLPIHLQKHEYLEGWLKDREIPKILQRLKNAVPINLGTRNNLF